MAGEEWAWSMLKKGLKLSDDDIVELREGIMELKDTAPQLKKRAELTEMRVHAICLYLKEKDHDAWVRAEKEAIEFKRRTSS